MSYIVYYEGNLLFFTVITQYSENNVFGAKTVAFPHLVILYKDIVCCCNRSMEAMCLKTLHELITFLSLTLEYIKIFHLL